MFVYHYTTFNAWHHIQDEAQIPYKSGLTAMMRIGLLAKEARDPAIFCLFEPQPPEWTDNPHFSNIWRHLTTNIGKLCLKVDIDDELAKQTFVIDRGHMEGLLYEDKKGIPFHYVHNDLAHAEKRYGGSRIPLKEYLKDFDTLGFTLPEVIILGDVPKENLQISRNQPLIDEVLKEYQGKRREQLLYEMKSIPELAAMYGLEQNKIEGKR